MALTLAQTAPIHQDLPEDISKSLLLLAEETAHVGHWIVDLVASTIYWSDEVYRIHGVTKEKYIPELVSAIDFYHPDDRARVKACLERAISLGEEFAFEARLAVESGVRRVSACGRCFLENGKTVRIFGTLTDVTERIERRIKTEMLSEQLKVFVENSYDGFWDWHITDDYQYMSPRFWEMLGYTPDEKRHHPDEWQALMHPDDLQDSLDAFRIHIAGHGAQPYNQQSRYQHKDGSTVYVLCRGNVVAWSDDGKPLRMVGTHTDISAQRQAQLDSEEYAERFDVCVRCSKAGMWDWNIRTDALFWSDRFKHIIGITEADFIPHVDTFGDRVHPDDKDRVLSALQAHIDNADIPYDIEYRMRHTAGHYIQIHARGQSVRCPDTGVALRVAGSVDDITAIAQLRDKERTHHQLLRLMLEKSPDAIFVKDSSFRIMQANSAFLQFYDEAERPNVIGTTTLEKYPQEEANAFLVHDRAAFEHGMSETLETVHFPDGSIRTLNTRKIRFEGIGGEPHILGIAHDVTEREELIAELNRSNSELDDFAYIASHDLKEPLRGMHNHARFLLRDHADELSEKVLERIERITTLATHAENMVSNLLYFSRISRSEEANVAVDLHHIVLDVVDSIVPEQEHATCTLMNTLPIMTCNSARVAEVFRNLVVNGLKYNDSAERVIRIGTLPKPEGHDIDVPVFYVEDNGIGIKERHHSEIFRIFKQVHRAGKYEKSGGVGLTIVKKIIQNHGGKIWLESQPEKGTTFFFTLGEAE